MNRRPFIFVAGHHRSGTSLLHRLLRAHPQVSGFVNSGAAEDEGQHLQPVYPTARRFGGPGRYLFDPRSCMDEHHELATRESAERLWQAWRAHLDTKAVFHVEKSPPNLVRTRFLQALFPDSRFVVILRHPAAVACATHRRVGGELDALLEHTLRGYERFADDLAHLRSAYVLHYEDLVARPVPVMEGVFRSLGLGAVALAEAVARHATPVGSGTVARTERIPVEQRAEAAVIAWLRHETTGYDGMKTARVKGRRREVRRRLAERSRELLEGYRRGETPSPHCPLGAVFEGGASESWR